MDAKISVKFLGGTANGDNLTGSCTLLTIVCGKKTNNFLIDAGSIQCSVRDFFVKNRAILKELKPSQLQAILATHAHTDHIGRMPLMHNHGSEAQIICSEQTAQLISCMLLDGAKIQALACRSVSASNHEAVSTKKSVTRDRLFLGNVDSKKRKGVRNNSRETPLYDNHDVGKTVSLIKNGGFAYGEWFKLCDNKLHFTLYRSGHVLGGAIFVIRVSVNDTFVYLGFSGDLGRNNNIILPSPEVIKEPLDYWFVESTYGGKSHPDHRAEIDRLVVVINDGADQGKRFIFPSYAVEKAQETIVLLTQLMWSGQMTELPIYLDSPLAAQVTAVFAKEWPNGSFAKRVQLPFNPFCPAENKYLKIITDKRESADLVKSNKSRIVIAGSGMCDAGRVRNHLFAGLGNPEVVVCLFGYMTKDSLGNKLKSKPETVCMNGKQIIIKADLQVFNSFSGHADGQAIVKYTRRIVRKSRQKGSKGTHIFINHGSEESAANLKADIRTALKEKNYPITIPNLNEEYSLR